MEIISVFSLFLSPSRSSDGVHVTLLIDRLKVLCVIRLLELYSIRCVPNFPQNRPSVPTVWQDVRNPVK